MKKLNIAIVCDPITHFTSGAIVSTLRFASLLVKKGHKVIFIAGKDNGQNEVSYVNNIKTYRFFSVSLPGSKGEYIMAFPSIRRVRKILKDEKIDILHLMDPYPSSLACIRAARPLGIKIVAHSHYQPEAQILQLPKSLRFKKINGLLYRYLARCYRKVNAVICPTKFVERALKKYDKKLNTFVISNGVDLSRFKKIPCGGFIKKYNQSKNQKKLLYVGRLQREKSLDTLVKAMPFILEKYKNVHLNIVGAGNLREELERLTKKLKVDDKISFLGKISDEDLLLAYNASDVFILPSVAELEGMVVLEAMACGKPIIISDSKLSAASDFVKGNGFLFSSGDSKDLAEKILKLLKGKDLIKKMGDKSLTQVKDYDIHKSVDKLEEVYYNLLG